jgi:glycosyltransferase involved in cell wall biosynthesis
MRVTMLVRCLAMMRGGGETRHLAWARELASLGIDVELVTAGPLIGGARYAVDAPRVTVLRSPYFRDFVYRYQNQRGFGRLTMAAMRLDDECFCRAAWRHIAASDFAPDLVHAHALHQAARMRRRRIPVVINLPGAPNRREAQDLQHADALVADGWAAKMLPERLGLAVERVPKGVDSVMFNPAGGDMRDALNLTAKRTVVTLARLVPIKNVALLLDAFARVREQLGTAHLIVVGDGPEGQALRHRAIALEIADSVTFVGSVPHEQTPKYYRTGDVFALSSDFDNSPNVILEAMASGLPIVTTDVGGVREFVADRTGGAVVRRGDADDFAQAILRLLTMPEAARAAGDYNRLKASSEFSWRASALRLLDVYRRVVEGQATAA